MVDDTSLALPAEPTPRSSTTVSSTDRSLRVQQQVQLTLARRARKSVSNGELPSEDVVCDSREAERHSGGSTRLFCTRHFFLTHFGYT